MTVTVELGSKLKVCNVVLNNFMNDSRVLKESQSLEANGFEVMVVALHEDGLLEREEIDGARVHRMKLTSKNWPKNMAIQLIKYVEFIIRSVAMYRKSDVFHCNDLNALPVGVLSKIFFNRNAKIVYDAHEYETESNGLRGFKKTCVKFMEKHLIKYADGVITVGNLIALDYQKLYGIEKPCLVLNAPRYVESEKKNYFREQFDIRDDQKIFIYQGAVAPGRGIEIILEAIEQRETDDAVLMVMGFGSMVSVVKEHAAKSPLIFFKDSVPHEEIVAYSSSADFGISYSQDTCLSYRYGLPNKLFEYLMAEIPVVGSKLPEVENLVSEYGVGVVAPVGSVSGFSDAVDQALMLDTQKTSKNILRAKKIFTWENQEVELLNLYRNVVTS